MKKRNTTIVSPNKEAETTQAKAMGLQDEKVFVMHVIILWFVMKFVYKKQILLKEKQIRAMQETK